MSLLARFDIRTLMACQLLLTAVFSLVFLAMKLAYRKLHGISSIALGFFFGIPGVVLVTLRGSVPYFVSVVVANGLVLIAYLMMYDGVLRFRRNRTSEPISITKPLRVCIVIIITNLCIMTWFSMVQDNTVVRIIAIAAASGTITLLTALEILRQAKGRISMRLFGYFMIFRAGTSFYRVILTAIKGAPHDFMQHNALQAFSMAMGVVTVCILGIFFLIMVTGELHHAIEHRANHDPLTGILNRHSIEDRLASELDRAGRTHRPLSAVLIDVDHFKTINDTAGHAAGDLALRTVALGINNSLRSYDMLGRYGGDEFLVLLPETSATQALEVSTRIRNLLALVSHSLPEKIRPTVSIGIAEVLPTDSTLTLIARADAALYDAKLAGRNCSRARESSHSHPIADQQQLAHLRTV